MLWTMSKDNRIFAPLLYICFNPMSHSSKRRHGGGGGRGAGGGGGGGGGERGRAVDVSNQTMQTLAGSFKTFQYDMTRCLIQPFQGFQLDNKMP